MSAQVEETPRISVQIGATAREARKRAKLTQEDVAERLGVAPEVYGRMERGVIMPSVSRLKKLCEVLGVSARIDPKSVGEVLKRRRASPDILGQREGIPPDGARMKAAVEGRGRKAHRPNSQGRGGTGRPERKQLAGAQASVARLSGSTARPNKPW
jgi:transcriptional regulator with XRE-family HTH domain